MIVNATYTPSQYGIYLSIDLSVVNKCISNIYVLLCPAAAPTIYLL